MSEGLPEERLVIQYDSTFEEAVDSHLRAVHRLNLVRKDLLKSTVAVAVIVAVLVVLLVPLLPGRHPRSAAEGLAWASFGIVLAVLTFPRLHRRTIKQRLRSVLRDLRGSENPLPFQVELMKSGISTKLGGTQTTYE